MGSSFCSGIPSAGAAAEAIAGQLPGMMDAAMPELPSVTGGAIPSSPSTTGPGIRLP